MTVLSSMSERFYSFALCRVFLGVFESAGNPVAYSLISDYFPPDQRGTATSIYMLGIYIGGALSSLTILLITWVGWRRAFASIGYIGILSGILCLGFVKEPIRGRFDIIKPLSPSEAEKKNTSPLRLFLRASTEIFVNPTCRWVVVAGSFRFFGGYSIGYFMP
jgi:MFS family permease